MASFKPERPLKRLGEGLAVAGGVALVLMMLHIVADVATKYLFNDPIDGTTEIVAAYYMVGVVFLPLAYVTFAEGHLIVELFTGRMSGRPLAALVGCAGLVTLAYILFFVYHTGVEALRRTREGEAWETSVDLVAVWPSRWFLTIGLGAMALYVALALVRHFGRGSGGPDSATLEVRARDAGERGRLT